MNKIKLMYDVIVAIKDKESCSGNLKVVGSKNSVKIFDLNNEFEKNMADGRMKAKVFMETDCAGKKLKHESSTDFEGLNCHDDRRHYFMRHILQHGPSHHPDYGHIGHCDGIKRDGFFKGKLNKLALLLNILNSMKAEEQEDKSTLLSMDLKDAPAEMMKMFQGKLLHHKISRDQSPQCMFKEFSNMEILNAGLNISVNKNKEVERISLIIEGKGKDSLNGLHDLHLQAELRFAW